MSVRTKAKDGGSSRGSKRSVARSSKSRGKGLGEEDGMSMVGGGKLVLVDPKGGELVDPNSKKSGTFSNMIQIRPPTEVIGYKDDSRPGADD